MDTLKSLLLDFDIKSIYILTLQSKITYHVTLSINEIFVPDLTFFCKEFDCDLSIKYYKSYCFYGKILFTNFTIQNKQYSFWYGLYVIDNSVFWVLLPKLFKNIKTYVASDTFDEFISYYDLLLISQNDYPRIYDYFINYVNSIDNLNNQFNTL